MKKFLRFSITSILILSAGIAMPTQADTEHTPRDHDRLHPGLANTRRLVLSVIDSTRTVMLDPEAASFDDARDASVYIDGDTISYVQFATKHRFILHSDTLSYIGYENRAADFRLDRPVRMAVLPLRDGTEVREQWSGHLLQYGSMMLRHAVGTSSSVVRQGWTLTDGTDTVRNATRLTWTLDMAYADPDSVDRAMTDSVASERISEMQVDVKTILSERLLTERSLWFADHARYPVLTDSRVSRIRLDEAGLPKDTVPVSLLAMHYPGDCQYSDTVEEIIAGRPDETTRVDGGGEPSPGPSLSVGEPEAIGEMLAVTLSSRSGPISATITLFSDTGIRLGEPVKVSVGHVPQPYSIPVPSGWTGVVLLRIDSGDESYTKKTTI